MTRHAMEFTYDSYDTGITVTRVADSGEAGRERAVGMVGWTQCCDPSSPCTLGTSISVTDEDLTDVPRLKGLLETSLGEEFSRGEPSYGQDGDMYVYEINRYEDIIRVSTGLPDEDVRTYGEWISDLGLPVAEYEGEIFVFASWDRSSMWNSLSGSRGC